MPKQAAMPRENPPPPPALAALHLVRLQDLAPVQRSVIAKVFRTIPRPPRLLQHLLSPAFVSDASTAQLVDLIVAEPLICAKVLTTVNSPLYGLKAPVASIGQAVTYLGLNTVRSVCLQYLLISSFKADSPERQQALDAIWTASAVASELTQQLAPQLGFENQGALTSAVVLSFLGRLAVTATVPRSVLPSVCAPGLLERATAEQRQLGLCAAEIGRMLMHDWGLPTAIVEDAADIDAVMVDPCGTPATERDCRLALCYLSARLGERLAGNGAADLALFDLQAEQGAEFFHLKVCVDRPRLAPLHALLRSPELGASVRKVALAMHR